MNTKTQFRLTDFLEPVSTVQKTYPEMTVGAALLLAKSTHDAVFVYENEIFLGIISPSEVVYRNRYPHTTKVRDGLLPAPLLTEQSTVFDALGYMMALRVYVLPVMSEHKTVLGVVRARNIVTGICKDAETLREIAAQIKVHQPLTIRKNALVKDAYAKLKQEKVARLVVVEDGLKVVGIISRADLATAFMDSGSKQRFSGRKGKASSVTSFNEEKIKRTDLPLANFASSLVFTLPVKTANEKIIRQLLSQEFNCVVLVDDNHKAQGFLSLRDILGAVHALEQGRTIPVVISRHESITDAQAYEVENLVRRFGEKYAKRLSFDFLRAAIGEQKSNSGKPLGYLVTFSIKGMSGDDIVARGEHKQLDTATRQALDKAERQLEKHK